MNLIGISLNHNTAPIEIREALHLSKNEIVELIPKLKEEVYLEGFVLSTCNRTEIFGIPKEPGIDYKDVIGALLEFKPVKGISPDNFLMYFSCGAVKHIFSVATGIDSLIIGDSQILGQVREAFDISEDMDFAGPMLRRLFDNTLKVGKRAIRETLIGEGAVTVSYAAIQVVEKIFANIDRKSALVIGAGETGELAAIHLRDKGVEKISITNRTLARAEELAAKIHSDITPYEYFKEHLHNFDIVISATSSPDFIIDKKDIQAMMKKRRGTPVVLMDIAIPRDIDPEAAKIDNVFYHDIDSLKVIVDQNLNKRKKEIPAVEKIVKDEMVALFSWYNTLDVVPAIRSVRDFFEEIKDDELKKIKHKVTEEDYAKLEDMSRRLIGRLLHNPTIKLKELAESGTDFQKVISYTMILKDLYNLEKIEEDSHKKTA